MSLRYIFWMLLLLGACMWMFRKPVVGVCFAMLLYVLTPAAWGTGLGDVRFHYITTICLILAYLVKGRELTKAKGAGAPLLLLSVFVIWSGVICVWAYVPSLAIEMAIVVLKHLVLAYLIAQIVTTEEDLSAVMWTVFIGLSLNAYFGRWGYRHGIDSGVSTGFLGSVIAFFIPCMFFVVVGARKKWQWIAALLGATFLLDYIVFRAQRSAFASLVAGGILIVIFAPKKLRWRTRGAALAAAAAFVLFLTPPDFWESMQAITNPETDESAMSRFMLNRASMAMVKDHPMGVGLGCYQYVSPTYVGDKRGRTGGGTMAHNAYLSILTETGWPGMILWTLTFFFAWVQFIRVARNAPPGSMVGRVAKGLCLGMVAIGPAFFTHSEHLVDYWYWMVGLSVACNRVLANMKAEELSLALAADMPGALAPLSDRQAMQKPATDWASYDQAGAPTRHNGMEVRTP